MAAITGAAGRRTITLGTRTVHYLDVGEGPTLLFIHGIMVNGALWRHVIPLLQGRFRCIVPDLPLGAHRTPMPADADQSPLGVAQLVGDLIAALGLDDVTLVGNDTGGAICQLVITQRPAGITRLVLTNCDAFEAFFPAAFSFFSAGPRRLGQPFVDWMARLLRNRLAQRILLATVSLRSYSDAELDANFAPLLGDAAVRRDLSRFLASVSNRLTLDAARHFHAFTRPVLLVWGTSDPFFTQRLARRLRRAFPDARLELLARSRAFVPEDRPEALAAMIAAFVGQPQEQAHAVGR